MTNLEDMNSSIMDFKWQKEHLNKVSRTFALSIEYLPTPLEEYTRMQYLLCRIPDTIEDAYHINFEDKVRLLDLYHDVLHRGKTDTAQDFIDAVKPYYKETDDWNLVMDAPRLISNFRNYPPIIQTAITPWARELTRGMREYSTRKNDSIGVRIQTADDLEEYCYYVAGTVGHMIIDTLVATKGDGGYDITDLHNNARNYGIFLQHINIVKDVYDDYTSEDSVCIPKDILLKNGVEQDEITNPKNKENVIKSVEEVIDITENFIIGAEEFLQKIQHIDDESYVGWSIPYVLAVATMRELKNNSENIISKNPAKIKREEVISIVSALEEKDHAADEIRKIVEETPYHEYKKSI